MPRLPAIVLAFLLGSATGVDALAQSAPRSPSGPSRKAVNPTDARAQTPLQRQQRANDLAREAQDALKAGDFDTALRLLREHAALEPESWIPRYNLAGTLAKQGKTADAVSLLREAIDLGFSDQRFLRADPSMTQVRDDPTIAALLADWGTVLSRQAERTLASLQVKLGPGASITRDEDQRFVYANWADPRSFARAHDELRGLATWANRELFAGIADDPARFDASLDPIVVVALPPRNRFQRWVQSRFGDADGHSLTQVAGAYEHLHARLVSMDLGASLRHEFFHALHWRICNRLGQRHPIWILEGLASLVEDMDGTGDNLHPVPSWRTNTARRMLRSPTGSGLLPLKDFINLEPQQFNAQRPLAKYAQARAFFLFLHERAWLRPFLLAYCTDAGVGHASDPTGVQALEQATGQPLASLDKEFRAWLLALPEVSEEVTKGQASLNVSVDSGNGDGVIVVDVPTRTFASGIAPIRVGDVILAIDNRPTRDIAELIRVLGTMAGNQRVVLSIRRNGLEQEVPYTLRVKE